jgi:hypothetical protein
MTFFQHLCQQVTSLNQSQTATGAFSHVSAEIDLHRGNKYEMAKKLSIRPVSVEQIEQSILLIRGQKVLLDADLAQLYGFEIEALNRAVKRNLDRFPDDFMFGLTPDEWAALRYQIGTLE